MKRGGNVNLRKKVGSFVLRILIRAKCKNLDKPIGALLTMEMVKAPAGQADLLSKAKLPSQLVCDAERGKGRSPLMVPVLAKLERMHSHRKS
jgi:hypothetical protein